MTGRSTPYIVCDDGASPSCWSKAPEPHPATIGQQGASYASIRAALRAQGWSRPGNLLDRCPSCGRVDAPALRAEGGQR